VIVGRNEVLTHESAALPQLGKLMPAAPAQVIDDMPAGMPSVGLGRLIWPLLY
jgi:hypothetical protein